MKKSERLEQAIAAHQAGDLIRAAAAYRQLLAEDPDDTEALNAQGILHLQGGRLPDALACFERAAELAPTVAKYQNNIGNAQMALQAADAAVAHFFRAAELDPANADFRANLGTARMSSGDATGAEDDFAQALSLDADNYQAQQNLGGLLSKRNRLADALPHLQRAVQHPECQIESVLNLTSTYERLNRLDDASEAIRQAGETPHPLAQILRARLLRRRGDGAGALALLRREGAPDRDLWGDEIVGDWHHELALCADLVGGSVQVFEHCLTAKAHWRRADGDRAGTDYFAHVQRIARRASEAASAPAVGDAGDDPPPVVFFVGFPRSGTTLLEMMLDAHPDVITTAEADLLSPLLDVDGRPRGADCQGRYLDAVGQLVGAVSLGTTIVDKLPLNLVYCRAIERIFPGGRLLVALRDPRDVVLSCLMQRFRRNDAMRNFDTLEQALALYEAVMGLWLAARPLLAMPWLEYRYEDLVAERDVTVDRILDFAGIDRHPAMDDYRQKAAAREVITPSYRGVTEPIYNRAVGRWRAYENDLRPALDRLAPFVEAFGYEA